MIVDVRFNVFYISWLCFVGDFPSNMLLVSLCNILMVAWLKCQLASEDVVVSGQALCIRLHGM